MMGNKERRVLNMKALLKRNWLLMSTIVSVVLGMWKNLCWRNQRLCRLIIVFYLLFALVWLISVNTTSACILISRTDWMVLHCGDTGDMHLRCLCQTWPDWGDSSQRLCGAVHAEAALCTSPWNEKTLRLLHISLLTQFRLNVHVLSNIKHISCVINYTSEL